jgi:hypothetical protein
MTIAIKDTPFLKTALLCATAANEGNAETSSAMLDIGGGSLISHQINQLRTCGIRRFLIEIDSLPGALVALVDQVKQSDNDIIIDFIRSPQELAGALSENELLLIVSDGIIADDGLLAEIIAAPSHYIVTLDGREENSVYERIDLNSFWAGIALLDRRSIDAIAALPEGWSIRSSLLRQALQDAVPHRPLNQELVRANQLRLIKSPHDAEVLGKELLKKNARNIDGWIESKLFAPIISNIAPKFWNSPSGKTALNVAVPAISVTTLATSIAGLVPISAALGLFSILSLHLKNVVEGANNKDFISKFLGYGVWIILAAAYVLLPWKANQQSITSLFPAIVAAALLLLGRHMALLRWQRAILASPSLLALTALIFAGANQVVIGTQLLVLAQLILFLIPFYFKDKT